MIQVLGSDAGSEHLAAMDLKQTFETLWPDVATSRLLSIDIFVGAKLYGQKIKDLDLVVLIDFTDAPKTVRIGERRITLESACITIETKDHREDEVRFEWNKVFVKYEEWVDVTEKSFRQIHALRSYLRESDITAVYVSDLIWLRGVRETEIPEGKHNIIGADAGGGSIVERLADSTGNDHIAATGKNNCRELYKVHRIIARRLVPTPCDRKRLERILGEVPLDQRLTEVGAKLVVLRGRGGTGKTMALLRSAWEMYTLRASRVLILTYNKALRSDLARQLEIMGISTGEGIDVRTVHSFLRPFLVELSLLENEADDSTEEFFRKFELAKDEAVEYLQKVATSADIVEFKKERFADYAWDLVYVDEGQDWPANERDLLRLLYGTNNLLVADGIDQFVRNVEVCNWIVGLDPQEYRVIERSRCLRMKQNLGRVLGCLAQELDQPNWRLDVQESIPGGRLVVLEGDYFSDKQQHDEFVRQNSDDGNKNIDMLFCVPPDRVYAQESFAAKTLTEWKYDVWDGASPLVRDGFAVSADQCRIVQYDSSRGLEGWTVVCSELDKFYELKREQWRPSEGALSQEDAERERFAFRWLMIPLTRAISTLVISLRFEDSRLKRALLRTRQLFPEAVEWRDRKP